MYSFWTTSTRELTEMPRPVSVTSASVCSTGWSTPGTLPGTLVIRPLRSDTAVPARAGRRREARAIRPPGPDPGGGPEPVTRIRTPRGGDRYLPDGAPTTAPAP